MWVADNLRVARPFDNLRFRLDAHVLRGLWTVPPVASRTEIRPIQGRARLRLRYKIRVEHWVRNGALKSGRPCRAGSRAFAADRPTHPPNSNFRQVVLSLDCIPSDTSAARLVTASTGQLDKRSKRFALMNAGIR